MTKTRNSINSSPSELGQASLLSLFITFFKIGAFTFGGGWAMISIIQRELVENHKWTTQEDFLDMLAVAQSLPGILAVNIAVATGDRIRGRAGAYVSAAGTILPSFLIILFIAIFLTPERINNNPVLVKMFKGIRPVVVALIIAPVVSAARSAKITWKTLWIPIVVALAIWSKIAVISNPIFWIALAGAAGVLITKYTAKKIEKNGKGDVEQ